MSEKGYSFIYTGVDPYEDQLRRFRDSFNNKEGLELVRSNIEDFATNRKYDLTILVHALYYVDGLESAIKKIRSTADKVVIVHHGKCGINEVHQQFRKHVKQGANIISTWKDVQRALDATSIPYDLEIRDTKVNVSSCKVYFIE